MNDKQENKLSMYQTVIAFFKKNLVKISTVLPVLETNYTEFMAVITQLENELTVANQNNLPFAAQKKALRETLRSKTLELSAALNAYFLNADDDVMGKKTNIGKSEFDKKRDAELHHLCDSVHAIAVANAPHLLPYGFDDSRIEEIRIAYINFNSFINQPLDIRDKSTKATSKVNELIKLADKRLAMIDALMLSVSSLFEGLFIQYTMNRNILDPDSKKDKFPSTKHSIPPNTIAMVLELPYFSTRAFKLVNLSDEELFWNLSALNDRFVNEPQVLDANSDSKKLSSKLAPSGDYLLVRNPSANEVEIELTVIE